MFQDEWAREHGDRMVRRARGRRRGVGGFVLVFLWLGVATLAWATGSAGQTLLWEAPHGIDATAAATPACAAGIPATAVSVIGGLMRPKPKPKIA